MENNILLKNNLCNVFTIVLKSLSYYNSEKIAEDIRYNLKKRESLREKQLRNQIITFLMRFNLWHLT